MTTFSSLFLLSFPFFSHLFRWCHGVGASGSSFSRGQFSRMVLLSLWSWTIWRSLSAVGLNVIAISQDGPRCNPTRTAIVFLWPRTAENANAVSFVLFISTRSTDSFQRAYPRLVSHQRVHPCPPKACLAARSYPEDPHEGRLGGGRIKQVGEGWAGGRMRGAAGFEGSVCVGCT